MESSIQVGKYLVSPLTRPVGPGRFAASVSIRSGRGSGTHDRVMRFVPEFASAREALHYATTQGLEWIGSAAAGPQPPHGARITTSFTNTGETSWPRKN
nr:hypothetical protein [Azohydromonas aeria]